MVSEKAVLEYLPRLETYDERAEGKLKIYSLGGKIFLCIETDTAPLRLELRCDRKLAQTLTERYESVMESRALGRNGIEVICSGQLSEDEIYDLIRHAYEMAKKEALSE